MIRLSHITFSYPGKEIFTDLSLTLPESGAVAIMAPSGYGKTTLLRLIMGLNRPSSGSVQGTENKKISFLFQEDRLLPWLTARENVSLVSDGERADRWLRDMEITEGSLYPREMSGGMQRRCALARAMAFGGDILLLDEPFKGLDEELKKRIAGRIRDAFPLTVLSVHDGEEARLMGAAILRLEEIGQKGAASL